VPSASEPLKPNIAIFSSVRAMAQADGGLSLPGGMAA
jgi:hypothetical protein